MSAKPACWSMGIVNSRLDNEIEAISGPAVPAASKILST